MRPLYKLGNAAVVALPSPQHDAAHCATRSAHMPQGGVFTLPSEFLLPAGRETSASLLPGEHLRHTLSRRPRRLRRRRPWSCIRIVVARVIAGRRWVCASAWAAEAVCERPGSRVGLWGAPCPRGVARLWLGVERGGFCTSCGSSRSSEADRATRESSVDLCSRSCAWRPGGWVLWRGAATQEFRWAQRSARRARLRAERVTKGMPVLCPGSLRKGPPLGAREHL